LHLELAVGAGPRLLQHLRGNVGGDDLDVPAGKFLTHLAQVHRQRERLLSCRRCRAPDPNPPVGARGHKRRHHGFTELLERDLVAEEERFIGGHRLDNFGDERLGRVPELPHQRREPGEAGLADQREQPAFDQILLARGKHEPGVLLEHGAQKIVIRRTHALPPENNSRSLGAMRSSGSTAEQRPARATAPGMPQTTLLASSWATTLPPAAPLAAAPRAPSAPMPVRTSARTALPQTWAPDANSGSTAGRQKLTSGPSSSAMTGIRSRRCTCMCRPPGAR